MNTIRYVYGRPVHVRVGAAIPSAPASVLPPTAVDVQQLVATWDPVVQATQSSLMTCENAQNAASIAATHAGQLNAPPMFPSKPSSWRRAGTPSTWATART